MEPPVGSTAQVATPQLTTIQTLSDLPEELHLSILSAMPQTCWPPCAAVCTAWLTLVVHNREEVRLEVLTSSPRCLAQALRALKRTTRPVTALVLPGISVALLQPAELELLQALDAASLTQLELAGPAGRPPQPTVTLAPTLQALASSRTVLRSLDLSWSDAVDGAALGALLIRTSGEQKFFVSPTFVRKHAKIYRRKHHV